jgi:hypothetical protein
MFRFYIHIRIRIFLARILHPNERHERLEREKQTECHDTMTHGIKRYKNRNRRADVL